MEVLSLHPGVSRQQVIAATGFTLTFREPLANSTAQQLVPYAPQNA
jgi:hypothetical protein